MANTPPMSPNINRTAGATQQIMLANAAVMEYFRLHFKRLGGFFTDIFLKLNDCQSYLICFE
jgi:hypothetical protein